MTEKQKMLAGELYDPLDAELAEERRLCRERLREFNASRESDVAERARWLRKLIGAETDAWIQPPFYCDYGYNLRLGRKVFFNFNCVVLDVMPVDIGDRVLIGPAVQLYTATHPLDADERRSGRELAKPIRIAEDVWIGGGAVICPGVSIGPRAVIAAGAVVTRDVPADVLVGGNPARLIRRLRPE